MYNKDLKDLSLSSIISPESIVVVWCTNSPTHINILKNEIFPAWGVKYLCKWYWVKVNIIVFNKYIFNITTLPFVLGDFVCIETRYEAIVWIF